MPRSLRSAPRSPGRRIPLRLRRATARHRHVDGRRHKGATRRQAGQPCRGRETTSPRSPKTGNPPIPAKRQNADRSLPWLTRQNRLKRHDSTVSSTGEQVKGERCPAFRAPALASLRLRAPRFHGEYIIATVNIAARKRDCPRPCLPYPKDSCCNDRQHRVSWTPAGVRQDERVKISGVRAIGSETAGRPHTIGGPDRVAEALLRPL
jgi:hypothetical protein